MSDVFPTYTVSPDRAEFGRIEDLSRLEPIVISFRSETGARLLRVSADVPWLLLSLRQRSDSCEIIAVLDPDLLPHETSHGRIVLYTNDPYRGMDYIPCNAERRTGCRTIPGRLVLRVGESREVTVVAEDGRPASTSAIESSSPAILAVISGASRAKLSLIAPLTGGHGTARISISGGMTTTIPVCVAN